jgi:FkbM family methyltransferase
VIARVSRPATFVRVLRELENWHEALSLRLRLGRRELSVLSFRRGISIVVRRRSRDSDVVWDLFLQSGYERSFEYLRTISQDATVVDLGANIGCFSILAAAQNDRLQIQSYEPGPPNIRIFDLNCLVNQTLARRIHLHPEAVGGTDRNAQWHFDEENPGGSSLYGQGAGATVHVCSLAEIVSRASGSLAFVKIDIEGAEYELVRATPAAVWDQIPALSIEVHRDPEQRETKSDLLQRFRDLGFTAEPDGRFAMFLQKQ